MKRSRRDGEAVSVAAAPRPGKSIARPRDTSAECDDANASFQEFYLASSARTFQIVRRAAAGDQFLAGDAVQDAYVVMYERWDQRTTRTLLENARYVVGIAMHKLADEYRRRARFADEDVEAAGHYSGSTVEDFVDASSLLRAVCDLIAAQPARRRLVGVLYFVEDFSCEDIAGILSLKASTVRTQVERLRVRLRPMVGRMRTIEGGELS